MTRSLGLLVLCLSSLAVDIQAQETQSGKAHDSKAVDLRIEMPLRVGWRFKLGAESATELQEQPDATWTTVTVPHTWNRVGYYKDAPESHINTAQNVVMTQGVGWYKLAFTPPANAAGLESFLQFDAASRIATVWLNGTLLGTHRGGASRVLQAGSKQHGSPQARTGEHAYGEGLNNTKPALGARLDRAVDDICRLRETSMCTAVYIVR